MTIEIVSFPIKNGDFPQFFVCLPGRVIIPLRIADIAQICSDYVPNNTKAPW